MTLTLAQRLSLSLADKRLVTVPAQAHASISKGQVVQIDPSTGVTSAPADNDRLGLFGVALDDVASGSEGTFQISGVVSVMTGDTSAVGTLMNPMSDMMVNAMTAQTDGNGFCKLLEAGSNGAEKLAIIINQ